MKNKKGIAIIVTYSILVLLLILSVAFMYQSINANYLSKRRVSNNKARANAEKGIALIKRELGFRSQSNPLITHSVNASTDALESNNINPSLHVPGVSIFNDDSQPDIDGCFNGYDDDSNLIFRVKTFNKESSSGDVVIISQGIDADSKAYLASTLSSSSLYQYFMFYEGKTYFFGSTNIDGKGIGKIFVNGDAGFTSPQLKDLASFEVAGDMSNYYYGYLNPSILDSLAADGPGITNGAPTPCLYVDTSVADPDYDYSDPANPAKHDFNGDGVVNYKDWIYSPADPQPWNDNSSAYARFQPYTSTPYEWRDIDTHFYNPSGFGDQFIFTSESGAVSDYGFNLPGNGDESALSTSWDFNLFGSASSYDDITWQYYDYQTGTIKAADSDYWDFVEDRYGLEIPDYLRNLGSVETQSVNYLNTEKQPEWQSWLDGKSISMDDGSTKTLGEIIKTDQDSITQPEVSTYYYDLANDPATGIYINPAQLINGTVTDEKVQKLIDEQCITVTQFYNNVYPAYDKKGTTNNPEDDITYPEKSVKIDVACVKALSDDASDSVKANIIYVEGVKTSVQGQEWDNTPAAGEYKNLPVSTLLVNGESVPEGGLTVVAPYQVYVKGNFNTVDPQSSSVITNSYYYAISDNYQDYGTDRESIASTCSGDFYDSNCDGPQHLPGLYDYYTDIYGKVGALEYPYEANEAVNYPGKNNPEVNGGNYDGNFTQRISLVSPNPSVYFIGRGSGTLNRIGSIIESKSWGAYYTPGAYDRGRVNYGNPIGRYSSLGLKQAYDTMLETDKPPGDYSGTSSGLFVEVSENDFLVNTKF